MQVVDTSKRPDTDVSTSPAKQAELVDVALHGAVVFVSAAKLPFRGAVCGRMSSEKVESGVREIADSEPLRGRIPSVSESRRGNEPVRR